MTTRAQLRRAATALPGVEEHRDGGEVGDLPRALGNPATRALVGAGITTLDDVARRRPADLLDLHGFGRRGVTVLATALADRELPDWRDHT